MLKIAVCTTAYNRRDITLRGLNSIFSQQLPPQTQLDVYVFDDGSSDGTSEAIERYYPSVHLLKGDGKQFWVPSLRQAVDSCLQQEPHFIWVVNDDVVFRLTALSDLLACYYRNCARYASEAIVVGSTKDSKTQSINYGGQMRFRGKHPVRFELLKPVGEDTLCDTFNANCLLIPRNVFSVLGNFSDVYSQCLADYDLGLRATKAGFYNVVMGTEVGYCDSNPPAKIVPLKFSHFFKHLNRPQGIHVAGARLMPWKEWKIFCQRHAGPLWLYYFLSPYRRLFKKSAWCR